MNANNPNNNPVSDTEEQIEKLFRSAPVLKRDPKADEKFYMQLLELAQSKQEAEENLTETHVYNFWQAFFAPFKKMNLAYSAITALIVIFIGGTVLAYQPGTVYGDLMYGWKIAGEKLELAFATTPMQKVNTYLRFSDRRFGEVQHIIGDRPSLMSLIPAAKAYNANDFISLSGSDEYKLEHTLSDMCAQIELASQVIENKITDPSQAEKALASIEALTEKQRTQLDTVNKKVKKPVVQKIVIRFINQEDLHLARSLVAKEKAQTAIVLKVKTINIKMKLDGEQNVQFANSINIQAADNVRDTINMFNNMQIQHRENFEKKIEMAKQALEEGKFGRAHGLSQALFNQMTEIKLNPEMENYFQEVMRIPPELQKIVPQLHEEIAPQKQKIESKKNELQENSIKKKSENDENKTEKEAERDAPKQKNNSKQEDRKN